jgi:hypothetical protein
MYDMDNFEIVPPLIMTVEDEKDVNKNMGDGYGKWFNNNNNNSNNNNVDEIDFDCKLKMK